jgi:hypothetical protein
MSKHMTLGGYFKKDGVRHQLPLSVNPNALVIEDFIRKVANTGNGVVALRCQPLPEIGPYELTLSIEGVVFLLVLSEHDKAGEHHVRTPTNEKLENHMIHILEEMYPAKATTDDINFVIEVFKEFAVSGDVSKNKLN